MIDTKAPHAELGHLILTAREKKRWTRRRLAQAAGYDTPHGGITISKIERGLMRPSDKHLFELAAALDIPRAIVNELAAGTKYNPLAAGANRRRSERLNERTAQLQVDVDYHYGPLEEAITKIEQHFLGPFLDYAAALAGADDEIGTALARATALESSAKRSASLRAGIARHRIDIADSLGMGLVGNTTIGATHGAVIGTRLANATYTKIAAMAKGSTGAPINSLHGAPKSKATLAALGGGSRSTGGFGMAGGRVVLGTLVAVPALVGAGIAYYQASKQWLDETERLDTAYLMFEDNERRICETFDWTIRARGYLGLVQTTSAETMGRLVGDAKSIKDVPPIWADLDDTQRDAVRGLVELSAATLTVLPLPVLPTLDDSDDEDVDTLGIWMSEWNDAVLDDAITGLSNVLGQVR